MKAILIVFMTFHFEAMPVTTNIVFETMAKCQAAKNALIAGYELQRTKDTWGRQRFIAECVSA